MLTSTSTSKEARGTRRGRGLLIEHRERRTTVDDKLVRWRCTGLVAGRGQLTYPPPRVRETEPSCSAFTKFASPPNPAYSYSKTNRPSVHRDVVSCRDGTDLFQFEVEATSRDERIVSRVSCESVRQSGFDGSTCCISHSARPILTSA